MAFQSDSLFADFLRYTARSGHLGESAPAVNFLLEERVPADREQDFLSHAFDPVDSWNLDSWLTCFGEYYQNNIGLSCSESRDIATFSKGNLPNHLAIESNQDVVRVESVAGLFRACSEVYSSVEELTDELNAYIDARHNGKFDTDRLARLQSWLDGLNRKRDARPMFVAAFGEMEPLLEQDDWASQLRNALGLSHLGGIPTKPLPILLCRYSLTRVEQVARKFKAAAWAAAPTVLEAGGTYGPGVAFFPFPKAAAAVNPLDFGVTLNLATNDNIDFKSELLHLRIDYILDDFYRVGQISDVISETQLADARRQHFDLLEQDFQFRNDVP